MVLTTMIKINESSVAARSQSIKQAAVLIRATAITKKKTDFAYIKRGPLEVLFIYPFAANEVRLK